MRPVDIKDGEPTRVYLNRDLKVEATKLAKTRYGISFSELCRRVLAEEVAHPKGRCHHRPKRICAPRKKKTT